MGACECEGKCFCWEEPEPEPTPEEIAESIAEANEFRYLNSFDNLYE